GTRELEQVVLVGVPAHHGRRIQQHGEGGNPLDPGEKFAQALGVVPGGAQQRRIEARPIGLGLVPVDDLGVDACGAERRQQRRHVRVETARGARAHQGDRYPHSLIPAPRFISATATANSARSEEHTSELQSPYDLVCRLLLEKNKTVMATLDYYAQVDLEDVKREFAKLDLLGGGSPANSSRRVRLLEELVPLIPKCREQDWTA